MTQQTGGQGARRRGVLALHLEQLCDLGQRNEAGLGEALIDLGLDAWELTALKKALSGPRAGDRWLPLIAEGVAFRTKYRDERPSTHRGDPSRREQDERTGRLISDAAVGLALLEETQRLIDELVFSGQIDQAKRITSFRNKLGHDVNEIKQRIGEEAYVQAEAQSLEMVVPKEQRDARWVARDAAPTYIRRSRSPQPAAAGNPETAPSRVKPLLLVFGIVCALWAVFFLPRATRQPMIELTIEDVTPRSEIRQVTAAPPSLFVEVDAERWSELGTDERLELVEEVGRTARAAGYTGAHFKSAASGAVAQWLELRGARLIEREP